MVNILRKVIKITSYNIFIYACNENSNNMFHRFMSTIHMCMYMLKIPLKSVDAETNDKR